MPIMFGAGIETLALRNHFIKVARPVLETRRLGGVTKDSAGNPLGGVTVNLFRTVDNLFMRSVVSDANGNYAFDVAPAAGPFYTVDYLVGAPDRAGTSVNTLVGT